MKYLEFLMVQLKILIYVIYYGICSKIGPLVVAKNNRNRK